MLMTLVPLFDENLSVNAYSLFTQKKNYFLNPSMLGTGQNDGAFHVDALEVIQSMGIDTLSDDKEVFVPVGNISIFSDIAGQYDVPHGRLVLLFDSSVKPEEMYIKRLKELKEDGYKLAIRKLDVSQFEEYKKILSLMDYVLLNHKKIDISKAKIYFSKIYPNIKLCAGNIENMEIFEQLKKEGGYHLYEGKFYRVPIDKGNHEISPLKVNYIQLLNMVNGPEFELTEAADVIGQDTALVISLLKMVNRMTINSQITSIRHAAAMLGEKELKKWLTTVLVGNLYMDKPNEITRTSLLRAKFAENLAPVFSLADQSAELFLMGLFSVLDVIMETTMEEALKMIQVSKNVREALLEQKGPFALIQEFALQYENANWHEVSRLMVLNNIDMKQIQDAYMNSLKWYKEMITG